VNDRLKNSWPAWRGALWTAMLASWIIEGLSYRHTIVPDGISYLDIAERCMRGNWRALVNAYWSPGYPFLLACWLSIFKPSRYWELTFVQLFNCLALAISLLCFEYLLNGLFEYQERSASAANSESEPIPAWALRAIGYALFFWTSVSLTPSSLDTPDALVFAAMLLAAGIIARIAAGKTSWANFVALGAVLGLGYLIKAVMFPIAFAFLGVALLIACKTPAALRRFLLAAIVFALISAPFVLALSKVKAHFTFGDSAAINYAEYVDDVPLFIHWQGAPPGSGTPLHPTRRLSDLPLVYEYAAPIAGTYPPWSDPSYWYAGVRPHFRLGGQLNALRHSLDAYFDLFTQLGALSAGFLVFLFWENRPHEFAGNLLRLGFLWLPAMISFGLYALVHVEPRFLNGAVVLCWAAAFFGLRISHSGSAREIVRPAALAIVIVLGAQVAWSVGHSVVRFASFRSAPDWAVVHELKKVDVEAGDRVAFVGFVLPGYYWAHLAGVSIVAEVPLQGVPGFWAADPEAQQQVMKLFARAGAKAVVAPDVPPEALDRGWKRVDDTNYFIFDLRD
jgi:4-amino-4-deoxy-L-arabinose transferase-like glycosyltransferase